jgi:hypothetical protein
LTVVGDDEHFNAIDAADAGDQPGARRLVLILAISGQGGEFQKRATGINQRIDALPGQQFAAADMFCAGRFTATTVYMIQPIPQCLRLFAHGGGIFSKFA